MRSENAPRLETQPSSAKHPAWSRASMARGDGPPFGPRPSKDCTTTILLATDAWHPQVNGVVRALEATIRCLRERGQIVHVISPDQFRTIPCPSYPTIRLAVTRYKAFAKRLDPLLPEIDHVHIATEGPIAALTRRWCMQHGLAFTTSFHTRLADYIAMRTSIRVDWVWGFIARFHATAARTMTATRPLAEELNERGIERVHHWPLGVDTTCFKLEGPRHAELEDLPRPLRLYVGRVAIEKNLDALLALDQPGSTVIVGDGPDLAKLAARYPNAHFLGARHGEELAALYRSADVFVFPSRSETLGLVMLEALACGTPVAAYPVHGPLDVVGPHGRGVHGGQNRIGALHEDLGTAIERAQQADPQACVAEARRYDWQACTQRFVAGLVPARPGVQAEPCRARPVVARPWGVMPLIAHASTVT